MRFKRHVDASGVHPRMWQFLAWLDQLHMEWTEEEMWVTSLRRSFVKGVDTRHAIGNVMLTATDPRAHPGDFVTAVDIRRWALDEIAAPRDAEAFCRHVQHSYGRQIGVVLEPEWLSLKALRRRFPHFTNHTKEELQTLVAPHIHYQLKKPIRWTTLV